MIYLINLLNPILAFYTLNAFCLTLFKDEDIVFEPKRTMYHMDQAILENKAPNALITGPFNNRRWRQILREVCDNFIFSPLKLGVISPFGFELLEDKRYLSRHLRRFYAYIGAPRSHAFDKDAITKNFKEALFQKLAREEPLLLKDVVIVVENEHLTLLKEEKYICQPTDKLLDIQCRAVETDILTDYSEYLMATLSGLYEEKGEGKAFRTNMMWRWRFYQLYIMQEHLFGHLLPVMSLRERQYYHTLFTLTSNKIYLFYEPEEMSTPPTAKEKDIIQALIKPRIARLYEAVQPHQGEAYRLIKCQAYHHEDELEMKIQLALYHPTIQKIKQTYLSFE